MAAKLVEHEKVWNAKPISVNTYLNVLPSERNSHLDRFINNLPNGLKRVSEFDDTCPPTECVFGKPVSNTPIGKDRDSITVDLKDPSTSDIIKVVFTGESINNFPTPINSQMYIHCGKPYIKDGHLYLECSNACKDLQIYMVDRWVYARLSKVTPPGDQTTTAPPPTNASSATCTSITLSTSSTAITSSTSTKSKDTKKTSIKSIPYTYTNLDKLVIGSKTNVSGVVTFFKLPYRSKGTDYVCSFVLVDHTVSSEGISVVCFNRDIDFLPNIRRVGDIILLRHVEVNSYNNAPQILGKFFSSFHIFDGDSDSDVIPFCSSRNATLTKSDEKEVETLKTWKVSLPRLNPKSYLCQLKDIKFNAEFNLICYVNDVVELKPDNWSCLSVCDGTPPFQNTPGICQKASLSLNYICNVLVKGLTDITVNPGEIVFLSNLIARPFYLNESTGKVIRVVDLELIIDQGLKEATMPYYKLQENDPAVVKMKEDISKIAFTTPTCVDTGVSSLSAMTNNITMEYTCIADVKNIDEFPTKVRCLVQIIEIDTSNVCDISELYCVNCSKRYHLTAPPSDVEINKCCTTCKGTDCVKYRYNFVLNVRDNTGDMHVLVRGKEAQKFLQGFAPSNFYTDEQKRQTLVNLFKDIFKRDPINGDFSKMDCCLAVIKFGNGIVSYRLCDTILNTPPPPGELT